MWGVLNLMGDVVPNKYLFVPTNQMQAQCSKQARAIPSIAFCVSCSRLINADLYDQSTKVFPLYTECSANNKAPCYIQCKMKLSSSSKDAYFNEVSS
jgi:hypothetical protein